MLPEVHRQADVSLSVGTSSFRGERKAATQRAHSLRPQWDEHNNGCDQCTQRQQRIDKEFLKDQQACFTIYIALRNPSLEIRSVFNEPFLLVFALSRRQIVALQPTISCFVGGLQGTVALLSAGSADETQS